MISTRLRKRYSLCYWEAPICGALGMRNVCGIPAVDARERARRRTLRALEDKRPEEMAIVRVYILDPVRVATSSRVLSVFLAVWRGAGHVTFYY